MNTDPASPRHVMVASRKSDLVWALHHEVMTLPHWRMVGTVDPRAGDAFDHACLMADLVLIEADDLLWLWEHRAAATQATLARIRAVIILSDDQLLDVVSRADMNLGLLLRESVDDSPLDLLDLAIRGYMAASPALFVRLVGNRLRLDIVAGLSQEEVRILALVGRALSNRKIAQASGLAESRVKTLVHLVTRKLRMHNRTAVAVFAAANGLGVPPSGAALPPSASLDSLTFGPPEAQLE